MKPPSDDKITLTDLDVARTYLKKSRVNPGASRYNRRTDPDFKATSAAAEVPRGGYRLVRMYIDDSTHTQLSIAAKTNHIPVQDLVSAAVILLLADHGSVTLDWYRVAQSLTDRRRTRV